MPSVDSQAIVRGKKYWITVDSSNRKWCGYHCSHLDVTPSPQHYWCLLFGTLLEQIERPDEVMVGVRCSQCTIQEVYYDSL